MVLTARDRAEFMAGDRLPVLSTTNDHLAGSLFPLHAEGGLIDPRTGRKVRGLPVGMAGPSHSGGLFCYDTISLYQAGLCEDANRIVLGRVGNAKSAAVKVEIYFNSVVGYNSLVIDVKGEYVFEAKHVVKGAKVVNFGQGGVYLNAIDPSFDTATQNNMVANLAVAAIRAKSRESLTVREKDILRHAITAAKTKAELQKRVCLLGDVVEILQRPPQEVLKSTDRTKQEFNGIIDEVRTALKRYLNPEDLGGMFDQATTEGIFGETPPPLLVLNCEGLEDEALAAMAIVLNFFTHNQQTLTDPNKRFHKVYIDEGWKITRQPGVLESLVDGFKLAGTRGVSYTLVAHHVGNFMRESGEPQAVQDLMSDTSHRTIFQQNEKEIRPYRALLGLTEAEVDAAISCVKLEAIYKVGKRQAIKVTHNAANFDPLLLEMVQTRHRLLGLEETK